MANKAVTWTVREVLDHVPQLGIPHFQRGLVWGDESVSALLESLFYETPCGSFVLWQPADSEQYGIRLEPSAEQPMRYLVIDGQQRIRSLRSVFTGATDDKLWCLNLAALPEFAKKADPQQREMSLFVLTRDPAARSESERTLPGARNLLPLRAVEAAAFWTNPSLDAYRALITIDPKAVERLYPALYKGVTGIRSRQFFVSIQDAAAFGDMVNLYNRINSGGKRVEVEERAFARLVGLQPETFRDLNAAFDEVHGPEAKPSERCDRAALARDEVLKRQQERAFGFKLFIRVFLQVCQHHLGFPQGRTEFSFELAEKASFIGAFGSLEKDEADALWAESRRVLRQMRCVLRDPLCVDDLRFLPDTSALTPMFQLLIHYPGLGEERYRPLLAALSLRLMLAEADSRRLLELVAVAGDPNQVAMRAIPRMLGLLKERLTPTALAARLQQANSIQSRYVLMLYWLQRSLGAQDFLYRNVPTPHALKGERKAVDKSAKAEKQHLLPFIKAQALYGGELRRAGSHIVNSIGNLTYISADLNGLDGLADRFARLDLEPEVNLRAHLMIDDRWEQRVLADYEALRNRFDKESPSSASGGRETFERMVRRRGEIILNAFEGWLANLDRATCDALTIRDLTELSQLAEGEDRLEPARPRYPKFPTVAGAHVVRGLGYTNAEEDRLVELLSMRVRPIKKNKKAWYEGEPPYRWQLTKYKRIWLKLEPPAATLRFHSSVPDDVRRRVCGLLGIEPSAETHVSLKSVPSFEALMKRMPEIDQQLAEETKKP